MKKTLKIAVIAMLVISILMSSVACNPETPEETGIKVTFDLQNGSEPIVVYVQEGETAQLPEVGDVPYKKFVGWFKNALGFGVWNENTPITSETTIYACWEDVTAEVVFDLNYEGAPTLDTQKLNLGELVAEPENIPSRECWRFVGWFTDQALTAEYNWDEPLSVEKLTLYGSWKLEDGHTHEYVTVTTPCCIIEGYDTHTCRCGETYSDNKKPISGHSFDYSGDDYFGMIYCSNAGCIEVARKESLRIYEDDFVYDLNDTKKAEIDSRYDQIIALLGGLAKYDASIHGYVKDSDRYNANLDFEKKYEAFYEDLNYITEQYQYAYVFYCVDESDANTDIYEFISEYRTDKISDFYKLYRLIYDTEFREYFYSEEQGWTEEDIKKALLLADSYGDDEYKKINDDINEIEIEFRELGNPGNDAAVPEMYEEFVKLNNQLAKLAGYDNYIEYAYENVYSRDYTPEETAKMRKLVKENFNSIIRNLYYAYRSTTSSVPASGTAAYDAYAAIMGGSIFTSAKATEYVKSYFEVLKSSTAGAQEIDFYLHANDLFKNGNYYTGDYKGAFSYWIPAQETSILYFGPGSYSGPFTFVHEFGHYYQNVYNKGISVSYDLEEIYSQGNEVLFLAYLEDMLDKELLREMYDDVYYGTLFDSLSIIMLATAIDEFEYCVYTGTSPEGTPAEYTAKDYDALFKKIMNSYGIGGILNETYWRYVVIEAPCYYISYAMSAIPCLELFSVADAEGFDAAKEIYLKLFTFTDDPANIEIDEMGDKMVTIGFAETLEYVGLHSVFEADAYARITEYLLQKKDFTYSN